jgi:hypothetical protein
MVKEIVEPMFGTMLPGPLAKLHFVKLDLGDVPLQLSKVEVSKTEYQGIKLDLDVDWDGDCDIELEAHMIPKLVRFPRCSSMHSFLRRQPNMYPVWFFRESKGCIYTEDCPSCSVP